jgi:hypothetical protein
MGKFLSRRSWQLARHSAHFNGHCLTKADNSLTDQDMTAREMNRQSGLPRAVQLATVSELLRINIGLVANDSGFLRELMLTDYR